MNYKEEYNFGDINEGVKQIRKNIGKRTVDFTRKFWSAVKRERKETKEMFKILSRMIKGKDVTLEEKKFVRDQAKDLVRIIPLVAISSIPVPVPIVPFLIALGEKYNFSFLPDSHKKNNLFQENKKFPTYDEWLLEKETSEYQAPKYLVSPALDPEGNQEPSDEMVKWLEDRFKKTEYYFQPGIKSSQPPKNKR